MKLDEAAIKMAYEAGREQFLRIYSEVPVDELPQELSPNLYEAYQRGYGVGYRDATEYEPAATTEPVAAREPPAELDGEFAKAWERGYACGTSRGRIHAQTLIAGIWRQFKSTLPWA